MERTNPRISPTTLPPDFDPPPLSVGRYQVLELLGRGAWGEVYSCHDPVLDRRVAVKIQRSDMASSTPKVMARFHTEVRVLSRLGHPNLVGVFDAGDQDGRPFLVMELCAGPSLHQLLGATRVSPAEAAWVLREMVQALTYLHGLKVVHRDLKPGNLLFHADRLKLTDFGLVHTEYSELTDAGEAMGTPSYMAPEQVVGEAMDHRTDLYALGVVAFQMLAGRLPFEGQAIHQMYQTVNSRPPTFSQVAPGLPPGLDAFFERALARAPADRFASAAELYAALLEHLPVPCPVQLPPALAPRTSHPLQPSGMASSGRISGADWRPGSGGPGGQPVPSTLALSPEATLSSKGPWVERTVPHADVGALEGAPQGSDEELEGVPRARFEGLETTPRARSEGTEASSPARHEGLEATPVRPLDARLDAPAEATESTQTRPFGARMEASADPDEHTSTRPLESSPLESSPKSQGSLETSFSPDAPFLEMPLTSGSTEDWDAGRETVDAPLPADPPGTVESLAGAAFSLDPPAGAAPFDSLAPSPGAPGSLLEMDSPSPTAPGSLLEMDSPSPTATDSLLEMDPPSTPADPEMTAPEEPSRHPGAARPSSPYARLEIPTPQEPSSRRGRTRHSSLYAGLAAGLVGMLLLLGVAHWLRNREAARPGQAAVVHLKVDSSPPGARIELADRTLLGNAPLKVDVSIGGNDYLELVGRKAGWRPKRIKREAHPGDELEVQFVLEPSDGDPEDHLAHLPPGAVPPSDEIGRNVPADAPDEGREAAPAAPAARPAARVATKPASRVSSAANGFLVIRSTPAARILIDGAPNGLTGSKRRLPVPAGAHVVELREAASGVRHVSRDVTVRAGETQDLEYDFIDRAWKISR